MSCPVLPRFYEVTSLLFPRVQLGVQLSSITTEVKGGQRVDDILNRVAVEVVRRNACANICDCSTPLRRCNLRRQLHGNCASIRAEDTNVGHLGLYTVDCLVAVCTGLLYGIMSDQRKPPMLPNLKGEVPGTREVITEKLVIACLRADKGEDAVFQSYKIKDFTKVGDNYISVVTSVQVQYTLGEKDHQVGYVVKLNPNWKFGEATDVLREFFSKEGGFYKEIKPVLDQELMDIGLPCLRMPHCHLFNPKEGAETLFLEDLRDRDFKMFDRRKGLDLDHSLLVVKELARLHAASVLLQKKSEVDLTEAYPYLKDGFMSQDTDYESFTNIFRGLIGASAQLAKACGGYDNVVAYLKEELEPNCMTIYRKMLNPCGPFVTIIHGDCWTNNFLFRYDEKGRPVELMLVDLQIVRKSSPTTDLNYLFYTSLNGSDRRKNLEKLLREYYAAFQEVITSGGLEMDFTFQELLEDYKTRNMLGFLKALIIMPTVLKKDGERFTLSKLDGENMKTVMKETEQLTVTLSNDPVIKERFLSVLDDMVVSGVV
ncbi:uncharacterized protein LOC143019993 [Oratosquilla oratoria]|uniref:uncharacterized protein LOC143019993 n=1 Tax=Oratosquilla oratoria TaxID=337810 RepID=UPI003F75DF55